MILLSFHPVGQITALVLACYAFYLGFARTRSLHFGTAAPFNKDRHIVVGSLALLLLTGGMAGGAIMVAKFLENPLFQGMHGKGGLGLLPFLIFGLFTGFYMYLNPTRRRILPALHALNNLIVLLLGMFQLFTGSLYYLKLLANAG